MHVGMEGRTDRPSIHPYPSRAAIMGWHISALMHIMALSKEIYIGYTMMTWLYKEDVGLRRNNSPASSKSNKLLIMIITNDSDDDDDGDDVGDDNDAPTTGAKQQHQRPVSP